MPKFKRERQRFHAKPVDMGASAMMVDAPVVHNPATNEELITVHRTMSAVPALSEADIFGAVGKPADTTGQTQNETLARTGETADNTVLKKKERRQQRHERWLQKLGSVYMSKTSSKKKKGQNVGTLTLDTIKDILPSVLEEESPKAKTDVARKKKAKPVSQSARQAAAVSEIVRFQKVLQHPTFRNNPIATIRQHLQNTITPDGTSA
ncbi:uncharacterized protein SPPG_03638 [Spizellomyces punctatus DAOM BR117]|uniref:Ribosome biogenesis protein SLX9 n=1 Tax=Spizellomyces punctatus (strain DAOM BR117) TaxID=645134 RepID=A0A0L0HLB2_SPIPD|nr:uncharacterized protein SPPG_03638 [Spizellomyces punctatus DAOM BR117]KND01848.1 hypothetical protein SPPG_03638 [Spizellomyces punctatus DAOM BR117]|eukprot:XP_016609887.1 hypothetical protein SPPG_03638 [Spizellomyces punctatus DAOM BR117]